MSVYRDLNDTATKIKVHNPGLTSDQCLMKAIYEHANRSSYEKIQSSVANLRENNSKLSYADAVGQVVQEHPEWYDEYTKEIINKKEG
jgi:hypothetical protein